MATKRCILCIALITGLGLFALTPPVPGAKMPVTDRQISDVVEDELVFDSVVPSYRIDVATRDGIVTLSGTVGNLLAKERAARIAETVKGVRAVVNQVMVSPSILLSDRRIREDIEDALLNDPATEAFEILVSVKDHVATLSGTVDSWQERTLAEKVAKGVNGVAEIRNNIKVSYPGVRSDFEIKKEIEQVLRWDVFVDHALIEVKVDSGKVALNGVVGSAAEKTAARMDAFVDGVTAVDVRGLEVKRWARDPDLRKDKYGIRTDDQIRRAVLDVFLRDPRVLAFNVDATVENGIVTLRGTVDNLKAKQAAAQDARNTVGVVYVKNRLKVRPTAYVSDERIEEKIRNALDRNPFVHRYDIVVEVDYGIAKLYGSVDSRFERSEAEGAASVIRGVVDVRNYITVEDLKEPLYYEPYVAEGIPERDGLYDYDPGFTLKSDAAIKEEIEDELFWSPFVDADQVMVEVEDGKATLSGSVDSWSEYFAAEENAYEGGALLVDNELLVK